MQITKEAIKKAAEALMNYNGEAFDLRGHCAGCNEWTKDEGAQTHTIPEPVTEQDGSIQYDPAPCGPVHGIQEATKIILSQCTETEDEPTYACTDAFADKVLESDDVHQECAERLYDIVYNNTIGTMTIKKIFIDTLARYFPKHREMKEALGGMLEECSTEFDAGTEQYECKGCGIVMDAGNVHQSDCVVVRARTALGLEGK